MRFRLLVPAVLASALLLSACGETNFDRAASGGAIGATAGAVGSAIAGGPMLGWTLLGGAAGAASGLITDKDDVDLGKPIWKK